MSDRRVEINRMSKEQAKKEAVIQLNHRLIDSLRFTSELDSIKLISHQHLISEQESEIALQTTQLYLKDTEIELKSSRQKHFMALVILGMILAGFLSWMVYANKKNYKLLQTKNKAIEYEKERSEKLLLNILPKYIANELKESSVVKTRTINMCTVLFTDFINF
ncbi:MAG: adenylate cyclase [Saprospiraceae bacterium]